MRVPVMLRGTLLVLVALASLASPGHALAKSKTKPTKTQGEALSIVTGPKTGTYIAIGNDIASVARKAGLSLQVKDSDGSIDNIRRINSAEHANLGIVQSDILGFLSRSQNPDTMRMASNLRMILPLYREEVHILARSEIRSLADLEGKKIIVGEDGSGHMLTAVNLFAMMGVSPSQLVKKPAPEGVVDLLDQKVDALIFVGGKPVRLFKNLEKLKTDNNQRYQQLLQQVHFLPLSDPRMLQEYDVAEINAKDYDFVSTPVPTIAVTAVLVAFDYSDGNKHKSRCRQIRTLSDALSRKLPELQEKGHPKWKEVKGDTKLAIWKRDACAYPPPAKASKPARQNLSKDLVDTIRQR